MREKLFILATCGVMFFIAGCASTKQHVYFPNQKIEIGNPEMARIYVVRPTSFGCGVTMKISDGNKSIGQTGAKGFLCWERRPGEATIKGKAENTSQLSILTEKGKSYYIQQHVRMGFIFARNKLSLLSEEDGRAKLAKCKPPER